MRYSKYLSDHIPPYEVNLENGGSESRYADWFYKDYVEFYTPYMIRKLKKFGKNFGNCNILDIGCGGGPLTGAVFCCIEKPMAEKAFIQGLISRPLS